MDGLLIDSEPIWNEAADEIFKQYGLRISTEQYATTTGMRIKEFVLYWFRQIIFLLKMPQQRKKKYYNW